MGIVQRFLDKVRTMKGLLIALALISTAAAISRDVQWEAFKLKFKKGYRSLEQENERKEIFMSTLDTIEKHNIKFEAGLSTYKQGINQFSDLTFEEFSNTVLMREVQDSSVDMKNLRKQSLPRKPKYHPDSHDYTYVWDPSRIKANVEVVGPLVQLEQLRPNGPWLEIPLLSFLNKCWLIVGQAIAKVDGLIELMTQSSTREEIVWNQTILIKLAMVYTANLLVLLSVSLDTASLMFTTKEPALLLKVSTTMDPTQYMCMPTVTSKITIMVFLMTTHAAHPLITMLQSMLDMTKMKVTGSSEPP